MELPTQPTFALYALMFVLGLCVGSFLNVLALRSLAEESVWWPRSKCPRCNRELAWYDNFPVLSYFVLRAKCRWCGTSIHWQYPLVEFITGVTFVVITHVYLTFEQYPFLKAGWVRMGSGNTLEGQTATPEQLWLYIIASLFFASTLIAITITDFREKLIPHEITYPAMIVGIIFSAVVRHDFLGAMAGIGASYILFDFIAFYGLKVYLWMHGGSENEPTRERTLKRRLKPRRRRKLNRWLRWRLDLATIQRKKTDEEPLEVMGGGDAVLSAVMSAFLGWQLLAMALMVGFLVGTIMGLGLLIREMAKANLLHKMLRSCSIWATALATAFGAFGLLLAKLVNADDASPDLSSAASFAVLGGIGGALIGIVKVGTRVSKPYPFGPALAAGGLIAIFFLPNWLY